MRKLFLILFLAFPLLYPLAAQTEDVNEQYELFSWEPVARAKQYGVTVEKYDASTDTWSEYKSVKTTETQLEILFTPGTFRVSISTYNLMGRKGKSSDWVTFKILEEHIPYLNERFLAKDKKWNAPVLNLDEANEQTLLIKGRNIFSPRTEFYLIPIEQNTEGGKQFINYGDDRKEQKLNVVQRNSKEYSVVVSYDSTKLKSGYYALEVRNPGDNRDSIEILVLRNEELAVQPDRGFEVDEHYNVNAVSINGQATYEFAVKGKGLDSNTRFYLEPAKGAMSYPFETELSRYNVDATITEAEKQDDGWSRVILSCETQELRTGYYNLIAKNWSGDTAKFICLVKKSFDNDYTKKVKKLKTKFNKKTEYVDVTIQDEKFDSTKSFTLVSQYDEQIDSNKRVNLTLSPNGKKLVAKLKPDQLTIAKYAIIIEDSNSYDVVYCDIDNRLKLVETRMSDSEVSQTFFRPAGLNQTVTLDADDAGSIEYYDSVIKMTRHMPPLFTNMRFDMTFLKTSDMNLDLEVDLLNFGYVSLSAGFEFRIHEEGSGDAWFSMLRVAYPNKYVSPYIGAGIGQAMIQRGEQTDNRFNDIWTMFTDKNNTYGIAQAGLVLFTVIDLRYNLAFNNLFNSPERVDSISVGFIFPLRSYKFKRNVVTQGAVITKPGAVEASQFLDPQRKIPVDAVEICNSTSVGGFAGYNAIEQVQIDPSVEVIEENAFADCKKLEIVDFGYLYMDGELTIKTNAFAGDTKIESIRLPSRTKVVQSGAFAGWTSGQLIILSWPKDDATQRDLTGLIDCNATVLYEDEEIFHGSYNTPLDDERNWCPINEMSMRSVSVHKDELYILGLRLAGFGASWYRTELDTWINQESPQAVIDYIQTGDSIRFMVQGDGNSYNFVLTTQDGGYFYYKFKTKEGKLTQIEIPYKKLKKYRFSSQKKLDVDSIKMCAIVPMFKNEWNEATFFDFEVYRK